MIGKCYRRHRAHEFGRFLETIDRILAQVRDEDVDLLLDARAPPAA